MFADFVLDLDIGFFRCLGFQLDGISIFLLSWTRVVLDQLLH